MTAQVSDRVRYGRETFSLVSWDGKGLFDPAEHGLRPVAVSTGNWLGYVCDYAVTRGRLRLAGLSLGMDADGRAAVERGEGPPLFGMTPRMDEDGCYVRYVPAGRGLGQVLPFTGSITLGADFIWDMYVHMGFHPPWKFKRVYELTFAAGRLTGETDRSAEMARLREAEASGGLSAMLRPPGLFGGAG